MGGGRVECNTTSEGKGWLEWNSQTINEMKEQFHSWDTLHPGKALILTGQEAGRDPDTICML
jgi:hypothetical protein